MTDNTYDQFVARQELHQLLTMLRDAPSLPATRKFGRYLLEYPRRDKARLTLGCLADAQMQETFIATIAGRGFNGKRRTVMLKDLKLFGCKFLEESHLWVVCDKRWTRIEPFYQGQKVVLFGTAVEYTRKNGTCDYTLAVEKVTKL